MGFRPPAGGGSLFKLRKHVPNFDVEIIIQAFVFERYVVKSESKIGIKRKHVPNFDISIII